MSLLRIRSFVTHKTSILKRNSVQILKYYVFHRFIKLFVDHIIAITDICGPQIYHLMMFEKPINRFCALFGHNYKLVSKIDEESSELVCKCCNNHFISTDGENVMNLTVYNEMQSLSKYFKLLCLNTC